MPASQVITRINNMPEWDSNELSWVKTHLYYIANHVKRGSCDGPGILNMIVLLLWQYHRHIIEWDESSIHCGSIQQIWIIHNLVIHTLLIHPIIRWKVVSSKHPDDIWHRAAARLTPTSTLAVVDLVAVRCYMLSEYRNPSSYNLTCWPCTNQHPVDEIIVVVTHTDTCHKRPFVAPKVVFGSSLFAY